MNRTNKKVSLKRRLLYLLVGVICLIALAIVVSPLSFLLNTDTLDVNVHGRVVDETSRLPLEGVQLTLENWMYEGGDYDGYGKKESYPLSTDGEGNFSIHLNKSAYIVLYVSKVGYLNDTIEYDARKEIFAEIEMKKTDNSN